MGFYQKNIKRKSAIIKISNYIIKKTVGKYCVK